MPDVFAQSHVDDTAIMAGAAANHAATKKDVQVSASSRHQHFCASYDRNWKRMGIQVIEFIEELGKRITAVTNEPIETQYLFHNIFMAIQRAIAVSFLNTFSED